MRILDLIKQQNMSKYRLSKKSGVPYTTINDICLGKSNIEKCSAETVYKLSKALNVSMDALIAEAVTHRSSFETFKSNVCHMVKDMGDVDFLIHVVEKDLIRTYFHRAWYPECLYLLAMVDYLSRENDLPLCLEYNNLRRRKLNKTLYPAGIHVMCSALKSDKPKKESWDEAIPEFKRFNIVESQVRNVI